MSLEHYAKAIQEKISLQEAMYPDRPVSRRGEISALVLDWLAQGYEEKRIVATLKYFRETVGEYEYADTITAFLREVKRSKNDRRTS